MQGHSCLCSKFKTSLGSRDPVEKEGKGENVMEQRQSRFFGLKKHYSYTVIHLKSR